MSRIFPGCSKPIGRVVALALALGPAAVRSSAAPGAARVSGELRDLVSRLGELAKRKVTVREAGLPAWLLGPGGVDPTRPERAALRAVVKGRGQASVRALAMLRLGEWRDPQDLPLLERSLASSEPAGQLPELRPWKGDPESAPLAWRDLTLGAAALRAVGLVLGRWFESAAAYREFRRAHPDLEASREYWAEHLRSLSRAELPARVRRLGAKDPELLVRVLLGVPGLDRSSAGFDGQALEALVRERLGAASTLEVLRGVRPWPELGDPARYGEIATWLLDHAEALFAGEAVARLAELWSGERFERAPWVRASLALALARVSPGQAREVLRTALAERPGERVPELVGALARIALDEELEALVAAVRDPATSQRDESQAAIFTVVAARGRTGLAALRRLVLADGFALAGPRAAAALGHAARASGCTEAFPPLEELSPPPIPGMSLQGAQAAERKAATTRDRILTLVRTWLRGP